MTYEWVSEVVRHLKKMGVDAKRMQHASITLSDYTKYSPVDAAEQIYKEIENFYCELAQESMMEATK